ncbi:MAG: hypothetical protein ACHP6I_03925 [Rickettsiales bacterium]
MNNILVAADSSSNNEPTTFMDYCYSFNDVPATTPPPNFEFNSAHITLLDIYHQFNHPLVAIVDFQDEQDLRYNHDKAVIISRPNLENLPSDSASAITETVNEFNSYNYTKNMALLLVDFATSDLAKAVFVFGSLYYAPILTCTSLAVTYIDEHYKLSALLDELFELSIQSVILVNKGQTILAHGLSLGLQFYSQKSFCDLIKFTSKQSKLFESTAGKLLLYSAVIPLIKINTREILDQVRNIDFTDESPKFIVTNITDVETKLKNKAQLAFGGVLKFLTRAPVTMIPIKQMPNVQETLPAKLAVAYATADLLSRTTYKAFTENPTITMDALLTDSYDIVGKQAICYNLLPNYKSDIKEAGLAEMCKQLLKAIKEQVTFYEMLVKKQIDVTKQGSLHARL